MPTPKQALVQLETLANGAKAQEMAKYHKASRPYLGVSNPQIDQLVKNWRQAADFAELPRISAYLWDSNIHEARVAAAKLLVRKKIVPDQAIWTEICRWVPDFDAWAIADHAAQAGSLRLVADPVRLDTIEAWTGHENMWVRRAALVTCLPWARLKNPDSDSLAQRERILGWAAGYVPDHQWFIQKAVGWWLRELSKNDPGRVYEFLNANGVGMQPFARKEALRNMP